MNQAHSKEQFNDFLAQLVETNANLAFFTDFEKVARNVRSIDIKLNQLNYLIGKTNLSQAIDELWHENPNVFSVLEILIAVRTGDRKKVITREGAILPISHYFQTPEKVCEYIRETGLAEVFSNRQITNLVDYVFGVEVGLDTNSRKNRSGVLMEQHIAFLFNQAGIAFEAQVSSGRFPELACLGSDEKRFDFMVSTATKTYLIEVNFYHIIGSKLNEVARAYSEIAPKINALAGFEFVWITDGQGWLSAKSKLEEAFYLIPRIYNLSTIHHFIKEIKQP